MDVSQNTEQPKGSSHILSPLFLGCVFPHDVVAFYHLSCITLNTSKMTKIQLLQDPFCCNYTISIYIHHKSSFKTTLGEAYFLLGGFHLTSSFAEVYRRAVVQSCQGDSGVFSWTADIASPKKTQSMVTQVVNLDFDLVFSSILVLIVDLLTYTSWTTLRCHLFFLPSN